METRSLCYPTVDEAFDDSSVIVVMDNDSGGINKVHNKEFFGDFEIASIKDLTYIDGNIEDRKFLDQENFKQILQLKLPINSKENVISVIRQLDNVEGIIWAGPNYYEQSTALQEYASDENYYDLWGLNGTYGINTEAAWDYTTGSNKIRVGIIDTGIANHPYLNANVVSGYDFVNKNAITNDDPTGHGTHVAGIIGASSNISNGVVGVNLDVELVPLQVVYWEEKDQEWYFDYAAITQAITYATSNTHVLNYSGGGTGEYPPFRDSLSNYNGVFVCAAGNGGNDKISDNNDDTPFYPANYSYGETYSSKVISVGAITKSGERRFNSNYGTNSVSIYAPGDGILSTVPYSIDSSGYQYWSGTSMAAPHVAGVAGLMLSVNQNLTGEELKTAIINNADEITISIPDGSTQRVKKLNAFKAVSSVAFKTDASGHTITDINFEPSEELTIPDSINGKSITGLGAGLFNNCTALTTVTLPDSVTSIGDGVFNCTNLTNITLPEGLTSIGANAFANTKLIEISIPDSVTSIGENAFYNTGIWNNAADNGAVYADKWCVGYKGTFTELSLSADTVGIADSSFSDCNSLTILNITGKSSDVGIIKLNELGECKKLKLIVMPNANTVQDYKFANEWCEYENLIFAKNRIFNEGHSFSYVDEEQTGITCFYNVTSDGNGHSFHSTNDNIKMILRNQIDDSIITQGYNTIAVGCLSKNIPYSLELIWNGVGRSSYTINTSVFVPSETNSANWVLVTDAESSDLALQNYYSTFPIDVSYTALTNISEGDIYAIMSEHPSANYIFYIKSHELNYVLSVDLITYMRESLNSSAIMFIIKENCVYAISGSKQAILRDMYSLGYNIAHEYLASGDKDEIWQTYEQFGYFPIIAPASYKNDVNFLMGISDVLGVPVKIISTYEEIEQEVQKLAQAGIIFDNWLIIDADKIFNNFEEDKDWKAPFEEQGLTLSQFYFFGDDSEIMSSYKSISENVYVYMPKNSMFEMVERLYYDYENDVYYDYSELSFNAAEYWESIEYEPTLDTYELFMERFDFWLEMQYPVHIEDYTLDYWAKKWEELGRPIPGFDGVFGTVQPDFELWLLAEQIVIKL